MASSLVRLGRFHFLMLASLGALTLASTVRADPPSAEDLEKRVRELEAIVEKLQAERQAPAPAARPVEGGVTLEDEDAKAADGAVREMAGAAAENTPTQRILAGWDQNNFILRSSDNKFFLRFTGQLQADYRSFLDGNPDTLDIDSFLVRRARLGIEANVAQYYEFRLLPDFSNAQTSSTNPVTSPTNASTRIQDAYMNVHYIDGFQVELGKFKQPFSYEQLIQDRFVPTMERSIIDQCVPARDEGVMIHGYKLLGNRLDYQASISNGEINGDYDTNDRKDIAARVAARPFYSDCASNFLRWFQVGFSWTTGFEQETPTLPSVFRTPATVPWLAFNAGVRANGLRNRYSPELSFFYRGFGMAAQYFFMNEELQAPRLLPSVSTTTLGPARRIPFEGGYVMATLLLTGEERTTYSAPVVPLRPYDPCHFWQCCGAWELVGRVSQLRVDQSIFDPIRVGTSTFSFADPTLWTNQATEMTLGLNWYLNAWVRLQVNYEHAWFESPVRFGPGPGGLLRFQDSVLTRFQVIF